MILPGDRLNHERRWQEAAAAGREESQTSVENRKKQEAELPTMAHWWIVGCL